MEENTDLEILKKLICETQNSSKDDTTFNFSHKKIKTIPKEIINIIKDKAFRNLYFCFIKKILIIFRIALGHNQLSFFPNEIKKLSRLRYLNIRANIFKEFPSVVGCS